jgi:hypothetical protein
MACTSLYVFFFFFFFIRFISFAKSHIDDGKKNHIDLMLLSYFFLLLFLLLCRLLQMINFLLDIPPFFVCISLRFLFFLFLSFWIFFSILFYFFFLTAASCHYYCCLLYTVKDIDSTFFSTFFCYIRIFILFITLFCSILKDHVFHSCMCKEKLLILCIHIWNNWSRILENFRHQIKRITL